MEVYVVLILYIYPFRYKEECQRLFDLQNQVLQSVEELSTDEEEVADDDEEDVEEMGKIVEKLISNGKSYNEVSKSPSHTLGLETRIC